MSGVFGLPVLQEGDRRRREAVSAKSRLLGY